MVLSSRFAMTVPECSIHEWTFRSCSGPLPHADKKIWLDADNPDTRYITFASARALAKRIAAGLLENGLQTGDRVMIYSGNRLIFPVLVYAIWMSGGVFTGANPTYTARELAYQLKNSEPKYLLAAEGIWPTASEAAKAAGLSESNMFVLDDFLPNANDETIPQHSNPQHWSKFIASKSKGDAFQWFTPTNPNETLATLNYSSGTTGLPKGVEITHYNLVALGTGIYDTERRHPDYEERARRASSVAFLPMYHAYCQAYFMISLPHQGMSVYIMPSFDLLKMLKHIETYRLTRLYAVPPVLVGMVKHPQTRKTDLSSIDTVGCGAAMLPPEVLTEVNRLVGGTEDNMVVSQAWGMSEVTCTATARDPVKLADRGVGELAPGNKAKILGEDGKEILEAGVPGEVYLSSPTLMRGYWRNPQATEETITTDKDGIRWLRTGDILYVDKYEPGALFHIVDRVKELIKVRGFQVSPAELDGLLLERDDVADVGVVGIQLEDGEEAPRAYIVRKPGTNVSAEEIDQWVSKRVAPYKKLRGGIVFIEVIPKNPSGKILRKDLKERAKKELSELKARL